VLLEVADEGHLLEGEVAEDPAGVDGEAGHLRRRLAHAFEDRGQVDAAVLVGLDEGVGVEGDACEVLECLHEDEVDLRLAGDPEGHLAAVTAPLFVLGGEEEDGCGVCAAGVRLGPGGESVGDEERQKAPLLEVLLGAPPDGDEREGAVVLTLRAGLGWERDEAGDENAACVYERFHLARVVGGEVEGAALEVAEVEQVVTAGEVDEPADPALACACDELFAGAGWGRLGHVLLLVGPAHLRGEGSLRGRRFEPPRRRGRQDSQGGSRGCVASPDTAECAKRWGGTFSVHRLAGGRR
jgi:hypothetical protein